MSTSKRSVKRRLHASILRANPIADLVRNAERYREHEAKHGPVKVLVKDGRPVIDSLESAGRDTGRNPTDINSFEKPLCNENQSVSPAIRPDDVNGVGNS